MSGEERKGDVMMEMKYRSDTDLKQTQIWIRRMFLWV